MFIDSLLLSGVPFRETNPKADEPILGLCMTFIDAA